MSPVNDMVSLAYRPMNVIEHKTLEAGMGKSNKMEPIGDALEAFGAEPELTDEL